jgi:hypothetical protein
MPDGSDAVPEAMRAARSGPLDYATVYELICHAPGNLPPRPEMLGPSPGGTVFWEEPGHRRRRQRVSGGACKTADTWKNSGGKRPVVTLSDPQGQGPSIDRRAGRVVQKST